MYHYGDKTMTYDDAMLVLRHRVTEKDLQGLAPDIALAIQTVIKKEPDKQKKRNTGKNISPVTIGHLISAHMEGDEQKFLSFANFIADVYEEAGNDRGARIIRKRIDGSYKNDPPVVLDSSRKNVQTMPVNRSWKAGERLIGYKEEEVRETANEIVMHFIHQYRLSTYSGLLCSIARDVICDSYCGESRESGHLATTISTTKSAAETNQLLDEVERVLQEKCEELTESQEKKEEEDYELE